MNRNYDELLSPTKGNRVRTKRKEDMIGKKSKYLRGLIVSYNIQILPRFEFHFVLGHFYLLVDDEVEGQTKPQATYVRNCDTGYHHE